MNSILVEYSSPGFLPTGLGRLDVLPPLPQNTAENAFLDPADWDEVHRVVQWIFGDLADRVHRRWPEIRSRAGRSSGRSFFLFAYRSFDLADGSEIDPVIVGLTFEPTPTGSVAIRGDIGGEESGRIDYEVAEKVVPNSQWDVLPAASRMAMLLAERADLVSKSVFDRHPPPSY